MAELPDVEATVRKIEKLLDGAGDDARELARSLMELYGAGLARVVEFARGSDLAARLAEDKLLGSLLLLHDLHPSDAEMRVRQALHRVERGLDSHHLVLEGIDGGIARVRVERNGGGSSMPAAVLSSAIERTIADFAPELEGAQIEGLELAEPLVQITR